MDSLEEIISYEKSLGQEYCRRSTIESRDFLGRAFYATVISLTLYLGIYSAVS